ncbi:MAG: hypothetical protein IKO25_09765 [Clostridia bacterium]|jgi:hypothetical protein|nr:hypothetical protein [Clostridia bacterium]
MDEESRKEQISLWEEAHPWLMGTDAPEEDDVDEVIRCTLDEIRFA